MPKCETYSVEWCRRRNFPKSNIVLLLHDREIEARRPGSHFIHGSREFYLSIQILRSVRSRNRPLFHTLKFTPDGSKLIGVSTSFREVLIYRYKGVQMAMATEPDHTFSSLFTLYRTVRVNHVSRRNLVTGEVVGNTGQLLLSTLITSDSRYLIVCSTAPIPESSAIFNRIFQNNESLPMSSQVGLEDIRFYSIDLMSGEIRDQLSFDFDIIGINHGVYLLDRLLAILSTQHQTIYFYSIDRYGVFIPIISIGRTMLDNDYLYLKNANKPSAERCFTTFRQHLLTFIYKESVKRNESLLFLRNINFYKQLKMQQIQLLGPDIILIRMDLNSPATALTYVFVLLEWRIGKIIGVFSRNSKRLTELYERFNYMFRAGSHGGLDNRFPTSMDYSWEAKKNYERLKGTKMFWAPSEIRRQFLALVPYSCVNVPIISPYLDPEMFTVDERCLHNIERAVLPANQPLRIFNRRTNLLHTELELNNLENVNCNGTPPSNVRVIFHPTDPFAISVTKNQADPLTTYHLPVSSNILT